MPSNKNPRKKFKNTLKVSTNYFKRAKGEGYMMLNKEEDF